MIPIIWFDFLRGDVPMAMCEPQQAPEEPKFSAMCRGKLFDFGGGDILEDRENAFRGKVTSWKSYRRTQRR